MQRRRAIFRALWLVGLVLTFVFARNVRAETTATVIEESFGTWYQWPASQGGNDHWYGVMRVMLTAPVAEKFADSWGGHLASFADEKERDFLSRIVTNRFYPAAYSIGLRAPPGQSWQWTDGTLFVAELFPFLSNFTNGSCCT